jgi:hypothetical protein
MAVVEVCEVEECGVDFVDFVDLKEGMRCMR